MTFNNLVFLKMINKFYVVIAPFRHISKVKTRREKWDNILTLIS